MKHAIAKLWIAVSGLIVATVALCILRSAALEPERFVGALDFGVQTILMSALVAGFCILTAIAIGAVDDAPEPMTSKAIVRPSPTWFWWPILYDRHLFLTVGPVKEQTHPVVPGWKWHTPTRIPQMSLILTDSQQVNVAVSGGADKKGNPANLPTGVPAWTVSDPTILAVAPSADGLSASVAAVGPLGTAQVQVAIGGLTGVLSVQVTAGSATSVLVTAGTPTEQGA